MAIAHSGYQRNESFSARDNLPCVRYAQVNTSAKSANERRIGYQKLELNLYSNDPENEQKMRSIEAIIEEDDLSSRGQGRGQGQGHSKSSVEVTKRGIYTLADAVAKVCDGRFHHKDRSTSSSRKYHVFGFNVSSCPVVKRPSLTV